MTDLTLAVVVLAAGQGTRMKSSRPKVLHSIAGRSLIGHVLATAGELEPGHVIAVVRHARDSVVESITDAMPNALIVDQDEIPGTAPKKAKKSAKSETPAKTEKRAWPKELPQQVAAVRDLLAEAGALDLLRAKAAFKGAKDDGLAASLDSLAALGLAVASGAGPARSWSAVR